MKMGLNQFKAISRNRPTSAGYAGFDNVRENIDPHIKTTVVNSKELILNGKKVLPNPYIIVAQDGTGDYNGTNHIPINAAIVYVNSLGGGVVFIKEGTYTITDDIELKANVEVKGAGKNVTIITCGTNFNKSLVTLDNDDNYITLKDLTIDGNGANQSAYSDGINFATGSDNAYCLFENIEIKDCYNNGFVVKGNYNIVRGCYFSNCDLIGTANDNFALWGNDNLGINCISVDVYGTAANNFGIYSTANTCRNIVLSNCISVGGNGGFNVEQVNKGISITNCVSYGDEIAFLATYTGGTPDGVIFSGCSAIDFTSRGFDITHGGVIVSDCYIYSTESGVDGISCTPTSDQNYIQINNNIINVPDSGIYTDGNCHHAKIIGNSIDADGTHGIDFRGDYITISNNNIVNPTTGIWTRDGSINATITGNHIYGCGEHGIKIWDSGHTGFLISNNISEYNNNQGLYCLGAEKFNVIGNIFRNNGQDSSSDGCYFSGSCSDINIIGNMCYDDQGTKTQRYGINLQTVDYMNVISNNFRGNLTGSRNGTAGANGELAHNIE